TGDGRGNALSPTWRGVTVGGTLGHVLKFFLSSSDVERSRAGDHYNIRSTRVQEGNRKKSIHLHDPVPLPDRYRPRARLDRPRRRPLRWTGVNTREAGNPVTITLNGERRLLTGAPTVAELLHELGLRPEHVAVELNRVLVPRARHGETPIGEGDTLE